MSKLKCICINRYKNKRENTLLSKMARYRPDIALNLVRVDREYDIINYSADDILGLFSWRDDLKLGFSYWSSIYWEMHEYGLYR